MSKLSELQARVKKLYAVNERKEDKQTAKEFYEKFVKQMRGVFPNFKVYQKPTLKVIVPGAGSIFTSSISLYTIPEDEKLSMGLKGDSVHGMIWVDSEINPNGITGKDDIARTFTIDADFSANAKFNQKTFDTNLTIIQFYGFSRDMDSVLNKFKSWASTSFKKLENDIKNKNYSWKNKY